MAIIFFTGGLHNLGNNNLSGDNKRSFEKRIRDCLVVIKGEGKVGNVVLYQSRETPHCDCTIVLRSLNPSIRGFPLMVLTCVERLFDFF